MRKYNLIKQILILQFISIQLIAQSSDYDLHNKYWFYKTRFNNDFISIGTSPGQSIPFNQREYRDSYTYSDPSSKLKVGDGTVQLGIYIGVLATEYRMLKDKGEDVSNVKHELFCALNAINRLDYNAEPIISNNPHPKNYNSPMQSNLNGFFVRDDIPSNFIKNNYNSFNYYNNGKDADGNPNRIDKDKGFTQLNTMGQIITSSSYSSFYNPEDTIKPWNDISTDKHGILNGMEESQDQMYYLLFGTALVSKLVDVGETDGGSIFGNESGETSLKKEAINISDRLIKHAKGSGDWVIRDPANGNNKVQVGASTIAYAYALDNMGCFIKYNNQDFPSYSLGSLNVQNYCNDYRNALSTWPIGPFAWGTLVGMDGGPKVDMQGFYHAVSAVANCTMETRNFFNTIAQAAINAIQAEISNLVIWLDSQISNANSIISKLPSWAKNLLSNILNAITQTISWVNTAIDGLQSLISSWTQTLTGLIKQNTTQERLINNHYFNAVEYNTCSGDPIATHLGSKEYFGIFAHRVLHPQLPLPNWMQIVGGNPTSITYPIVRNELRSVLEQAPCQGNFNFYPNRPGPEWGNPNRLDRMDPTYRYNLECVTPFLGEYHGLDYMLLHNLYYLSGGTSNMSEKFNNQSDRGVNDNFPLADGSFSKSKPDTKGAFEYITANGTLNTNADVNFRAGKIVHLKPDFTVKAGADFHAYIDPYHCASTYGTLNRSVNTTTSTSQYMTDAQPKQKSIKNNNEATQGLNMEQARQIENLVQNLQYKMDSLTIAIAPIMEGISSKILVYPNPNNGEFKIAFNLEKEDNVNLQIIDVTGKEVYNQKFIVGEIEYPFNFTDLPKGIYMAIAKSSKGETYTQKITINN